MFKFISFLSSPKFYFLDLILNELSNKFGYFIDENELVEKVTKETFLIKDIDFYYKKNKPFIDVNNEIYFVRFACQYLMEQKLIEISTLTDQNIKYTLTYSGLIVVKTGGIFWSKFWNQFKTSSQYIVWFVAILTFIVNCRGNLKYNEINDEVNNLKHKIEKSEKQQEQKLKKLALRLDSKLQLQRNSTKQDTTNIKFNK